MSLVHLSGRLATVALRIGDNMLGGRPRDPDLLRDGRRLQAGLMSGEDQPFLSRGHRGGPDWLIRLCRHRFRRSAPCQPALHRWTVRRIASAPPDFVGHRLHQPVELDIIQQAQCPAQVGRQGDLRFARLPPGMGAGGGRIRRPRRAFSFPGLRAMIRLPFPPRCRTDSLPGSEDLHRLHRERWKGPGQLRSQDHSPDGIHLYYVAGLPASTESA